MPGENGVKQESEVNQNGSSWWEEHDTWDWQDQFTGETSLSSGSGETSLSSGSQDGVKQESEVNQNGSSWWEEHDTWDWQDQFTGETSLSSGSQDGVKQESEVNQNGSSSWEEHDTWDWQDQFTGETSLSLGSQVKEEYQDENDTNDENGGWHASSAWHSWANSDSELQGVKADVKTEDEFEEEYSKNRRRKGKRPLMDREDVEASKGMNLDGLHPKETVNTFLSRYAGRSMVKGQDISYETKSVPQGFVSKLVVPVWSDSQSYFGQACATEKAAEVSAAQAFLADPEVIETASNLPPPMWKIRRCMRDQHKATVQSLSGSRKTKAVQKATQAAHDRYNKYRDSCRTAIWDGVA